MQFTGILRLIVLVQLTARLGTVVGAATEKRLYPIMTADEMTEWLSNQAGKITYVGLKNITDIVKRAADSTTVTYCGNVSGNLCSAPCTVTTGNGICVDAPGTNCLAATTNVGFCDFSFCESSSGCNDLADCGHPLDNGFCFTPGTNSITLPVT